MRIGSARILAVGTLLLMAGCTPAGETTAGESTTGTPTSMEVAMPTPTPTAIPASPTAVPASPTPVAATPRPIQKAITWTTYTLKSPAILVSLPGEWRWEKNAREEGAATIRVGTGWVEFRTHTEYDAFPNAYFIEQDKRMQEKSDYRNLGIRMVDAPGFLGSPSAQWHYRLGDREILRHDIYFADRLYSLRLEAPGADFAQLFPPERITALVKSWQPVEDHSDESENSGPDEVESATPNSATGN